jgi:hypothetical protein
VCRAARWRWICSHPCRYQIPIGLRAECPIYSYVSSEPNLGIGLKFK